MFVKSVLFEGSFDSYAWRHGYLVYRCRMGLARGLRILLISNLLVRYRRWRYPFGKPVTRINEHVRRRIDEERFLRRHGLRMPDPLPNTSIGHKDGDIPQC